MPHNTNARCFLFGDEQRILELLVRVLALVEAPLVSHVDLLVPSSGYLFPFLPFLGDFLEGWRLVIQVDI